MARPTFGISVGRAHRNTFGAAVTVMSTAVRWGPVTGEKRLPIADTRLPASLVIPSFPSGTSVTSETSRTPGAHIRGINADRSVKSEECLCFQGVRVGVLTVVWRTIEGLQVNQPCKHDPVTIKPQAVITRESGRCAAKVDAAADGEVGRQVWCVP